MTLHLVVRVALVARDAADVRLHPQAFADGLHVAGHARVVGFQRAEGEQRVGRRIQREVEAIGAILLGQRHAREQPTLGIPHVAQHRAAHALGTLAEFRRAVHGTHVAGEVACGLQRADGGAHGEQVHAATLFPQIPAGQRQASVIAVAQHPVGGVHHQRVVEILDELHVAERQEVLAQRPGDQRGLILLDGQPATLLGEPRMPGAGEGATGVVLVQEVSVGVAHALAEGEEVAAEFALTRKRERMRHQRAVARPHVRVGVAGEVRDVVVVGGDDGAAVVDLRAHDQRTAAMQLRQMVGQRIIRHRLLVAPQTPVGLGAIHHALRGLQAHLVVELPHGLVGVARGDPVRAALAAARRHRQMEPHGAVHAALRDGIAAQQAVLGVAPGALGVTDALGAGGPAADAPAARMHAIEQEVAVVLVVHQAAGARIERHRVAHRAFANGQIGMEEHAHVARAIEQVAHRHLAEEHRTEVVHGVVADHFHAQALVTQAHFTHQRVALVSQRAGPAGAVHPRELTVHPHAEPLQMSAGVVGLPHVRPVQVANAIQLVECDQHLAVADGDVSWHGGRPPSGFTRRKRAIPD